MSELSKLYGQLQIYSPTSDGSSIQNWYNSSDVIQASISDTSIFTIKTLAALDLGRIHIEDDMHFRSAEKIVFNTNGSTNSAMSVYGSDNGFGGTFISSRYTRFYNWGSQYFTFGEYIRTDNTGVANTGIYSYAAIAVKHISAPGITSGAIGNDLIVQGGVGINNSAITTTEGGHLYLHGGTAGNPGIGGVISGSVFIDGGTVYSDGGGAGIYGDVLLGSLQGNAVIGSVVNEAQLQFIDDNTYISKDGSNNLSFTDAVTGTKTLAELLDSSWIINGSDVYYSTGNVGVKVTTPDNDLHIHTSIAGDGISISGTGAASPGFRLHDSTNIAGATYNAQNLLALAINDGVDGTTVGDYLIANKKNFAIHLATNNIIRQTIDKNGNTGIGVAIPAEILDIGGNLGLTNNIHQKGTSTQLDINPYQALRLGRNTNNANFAVSINKGDGTTTLNHFFNGDGNSYVCGNNGNFGVGTTSSQAKFVVNTANSDNDEIIAKFIHRANTPEVGAGIQLGGTDSSDTMGVKIFGYSDPSSNHYGRMVIQTSSASGVWNMGLTQDKDGKVGINTTSPNALLDISSGTANAQVLRFTDTRSSMLTGETVGILEFYKTDESIDGPGVVSYIKSVANDAGGTFNLEFGTGSGGASYPNGPHMNIFYNGIVELPYYAGSGTEDAQFTSVGRFTRITSDENTKNIIGKLGQGLSYVLAAARHTIEFRYKNEDLNAEDHNHWGFGARGVTADYGKNPAFRLYKDVYGWDTKQMIAPAYNAISEVYTLIELQQQEIVELKARLDLIEA